MQEEKGKKDFQNPIDKDKVAEAPGILPYGHHSGSAIIRPEDRGKIKGRALDAMEDQTEMQMRQIREQIELLAAQAQKLQERKEVSEQIYLAEMGFEPLINHVYHLYQKKNGQTVLSMIGPEEWGHTMPYEALIATVRLLADHTWDIL